MCGINGILIKGQAHKYSLAIKNMNDVLKHRGPNGEGVYEDSDILLGHRRLSIIDLTEAGKQPMSNHNQSLWVTYNGEIFNFLEIKQILEGKGYTFRSKSDTEVIIHGFAEWGTELFKKLEGMFAFALWDKNKKELHLVRDACGVKPLFYWYDERVLVFSSEIKGLLASNLVERKINPQSLSNYLSLFYVPGPETIIEKVQQVSPGSHIVFTQNSPPRYFKFWGAENIDRHSLAGKSPEQIYERIREEVSVAVRGSLISDVPISLLLSSGLDSSIISHELKDNGRSDIETITVGFDETSYDESVIAKRLAFELGLKNHTVIMPKEDVPQTIEKVVRHLDMLNGNPCILAEYRYYQEVAKRYRVTLVGVGNDEIFAGYSTYLADYYRKHYGLLPLSIRKLAANLGRFIPVSEQKYSFDYLARKFTEGSLFHKEKSHYWWRTIFSDEEKKSLFKDEFLHESKIDLDSFYVYDRYFNQVKGKMSFEDQTLYSDFYLFLIDNANVKVDQLSMSYSLETRPPFLTKRFVEFAFSIPFHLKLKERQTKYCLRQAYKNILPEYITNRKKQGLVSPLGFLFKDDMSEFLSTNLLSSGMAEYFNTSYINELLRQQRKGMQNNSYKLFSLLCFALWHKNFILGKHGMVTHP